MRSRRVVFFFLPFLPPFSLFSSLSFSPHGGDTTVPSALHLFNKDLLCSKTLIQGAHTHSRARTNTHLAFFSSQAANGKKSEGCGIGNAWRSLCQLSL